MARILIAEDEHDIRELIAFTLRFAGHEVILTGDGQEAIESTRREMPDLVLMDIRMPRLTGYDACRLLKADQNTRHIPIVFLSAKGQEAEVRVGFEAGAEEYIVKPFSPEGLTHQIHAILSKRRE